MKKKLPVFLSLVLLMLLLCALASADVYINEIMAKSGQFLDHETPDWIELYNDGKKDVSLDGWYLSDKKKDPTLWAFPKGSVVKAGGYTLIYCMDDVTGYTNRMKSQVYFAPFKLSSSGETVYLTGPDGQLVDSVKYPAQFGNVSWGKALTDGHWGYCDQATRQAKNSKNTYDAVADRPTLETPAGFYDQPIEVTVSGAEPMYYTLDGSEPTSASKRYTGPIKIKKTSVLKVVSCPDDKATSYAAFGTYFIDDASPCVVISMSTDPDYLFGKKGLFISGLPAGADPEATPNYYQEWEYPMAFEYFDETGARQLAQKGSFRIVGTSTRGAKLKAVAVTARDKYGDPDSFAFNPFSDRDYATYHTFTIRPTGSDSKGARMRDVYLTRLSEGLDIMYQAAKLCVVYYNGTYYGQYYVREKINKYSVAQWAGVTDPEIIDQIDIVEGEARDDQVMNGSKDDWVALRNFVKTADLSDPENLKYVTDRLDLESFFTWASYEMLILNTDMENVRVYRVPGEKWKYILYDLDAGMQTNDLRAIYMLLDGRRADGRISSHYSLLNRFVTLPETRDLFLKTLAKVAENSFLYEGHSRELADAMFAEQDPIMKRHCLANNKSDLSYTEWRGNVSAMKHFARVSPKRVIQEVAEVLGLTNEEFNLYFSHTMELLAEHNSEDKQ